MASGYFSLDASETSFYLLRYIHIKQVLGKCFWFYV